MGDTAKGAAGTTESRDIEIPKDPARYDGFEVTARDALLASAARSLPRLDFPQLSSICSTWALAWVCSAAVKLPSPQGIILVLVIAPMIFLSPAFHRYLNRS